MENTNKGKIYLRMLLYVQLWLNVCKILTVLFRFIKIMFVQLTVTNLILQVQVT